MRRIQSFFSLFLFLFIFCYLVNKFFVDTDKKQTIRKEQEIEWLPDRLIRSTLLPSYVSLFKKTQKESLKLPPILSKYELFQGNLHVTEPLSRMKQKESITIAIHVFGWKRFKSLKRLLKALIRADYTSANSDIPLYIHLDGGYTTQVETLANNFNWKQGPKYIMKQASQVGLQRVSF
jgi:hypothetical protein